MSLSDYPGRKQGCVYHIDGYHGRSLDVYPNKCVFTIVPGLHSAGHGEFEVGEKTVWFKDTCSMFYHRSTGSYGWLVLEPYNSSSSYPSSHTFLYSEKEISNKDMDNLIAYINQQMDLIKGCPDSAPSCRADLKKEEQKCIEEQRSDGSGVILSSGLLASTPHIFYCKNCGSAFGGTSDSRPEKCLKCSSPIFETVISRDVWRTLSKEQKIQALFDEGILTQEEYESKKRKLQEK